MDWKEPDLEPLSDWVMRPENRGWLERLQRLDKLGEDKIERFPLGLLPVTLQPKVSIRAYWEARPIKPQPWPVVQEPDGTYRYCPECGLPVRKQCHIQRYQDVCAYCCNCPKPATVSEPREQRPLKPAGDRANLPVSTPQVPMGCSCSKCLTWVQRFPDLHGMWLDFVDEQSWRYGARVWWRNPAWNDEWRAFRNAR